MLIELAWTFEIILIQSLVLYKKSKKALQDQVFVCLAPGRVLSAVPQCLPLGFILSHWSVSFPPHPYESFPAHIPVLH